MSRLNVANFRHPDSTADNISLDSSGRVGIGTSSPGRNFQVVDSSNAFLSAKCGSVEGFVNVTSSAVNLESSSSIPVTFSPGGTLRGRFDTSGNLQFNSGYGSVAVAYGVRAWVEFDGGGTPTIRNSGNISSISDLGTGSYYVNFSDSMPDVNYVGSGHAASGLANGNYFESYVWPNSSSRGNIRTQWNGTNYDLDRVGAIFVR